MPFYGADPEALDRLRLAMRHAADDLDRIGRLHRCTADGARAGDASLFDTLWTAGLEQWCTRLELIAAGVTDDLVARLEALAVERTWLGAQVLTHPTVALYAQLAEVDRSFSERAMVLRAHPEALIGLVERLEPFTAALLLHHVPLDDDTLAAVATRVMRRAGDAPPPGDPRLQWADRSLAGPNTVDLLAAVLADRPAAARAVLVACSDRPELLLLGADRAGSISDLLHAALVDAPPAIAGAILRPIVTWTFTSGLLHIDVTGVDSADPRGVVAAAIAPWLTWFGPRADEFGWSRTEGRAALDRVAADDVGRVALLDALDLWTTKLHHEPLVDTVGHLDTTLLDDLAATIALIERTLYDAAVDESVMNRRLVDLAFDAAELVLTKSPIMAKTKHLQSALGSMGNRQRVERQLEQLGWLPPPVEQVRAEQDDLRDRRTAGTAVVAVMATVQCLIDVGRLPPDSIVAFHREPPSTDDECATQAAADWLRDAIDTLAAHPDEQLVLHAVRSAFVNPATIEARCDAA